MFCLRILANERPGSSKLQFMFFQKAFYFEERLASLLKILSILYYKSLTDVKTAWNEIAEKTPGKL